MSHMDDGRLHSYLDGELPADQAAEVEEHLATCADCRSVMDQARATRTRAHEILRYADPQGIVPPDFSTLSARRPAPVVIPERRFRRPAVLLPWAASVILALGAGWFAQDLLRGGGADAGSLERVAATDPERPPPAPAPAAEAGAARTAAPTQPESMASLSVADAGTATAPLPDRGAAATGASGTGAGVPPAAEPPTAVAAAAPPGPESAAADLARAEAADHPGFDRAVQRSRDVALGEVRVRDEDRAGGERRMAAVRSPAPPRPTTAWRPQDEYGWPVAWMTVDRAAATRALGEPPRVVPTLPVEVYQLSAAMPGAVRVVQRLPGGEALEVLQRQRREHAGAPVIAEVRAAPAAGHGAPPPVGAAEGGQQAEAELASLALLRGNLDLWIRAAVPPDSLRRLGERIP